MPHNHHDPYIDRALSGTHPHEEAAFIEAMEPRPKRVLDAGCGTGRVAIELARRGFDTAGVDISPEMLAEARAAAPGLDWRLGDLATVALNSRFDLILMAGNVMLFLQPGTEGEVLRNMAAHLAPGGRIVAGFHLATGYLTPEQYCVHAAAAGLHTLERYSTWHRDPWSDWSSYIVAVHGTD